VTDSDAILERLMRLHPKKIDLSLGRVVRLLDRLGRPQESVPPVVHVAGTNGKGSTIAFLRAMLEAAGYRVHVYTSPHLVRFNERIRLAGELIAEAELADLLARCEDVNRGEPITYFEITTAAAMKAFAHVPADILLLECGLGGRFDATTVIHRPALTLITPVSIDHQQFLGDTLEEIAGEKAAIQKPGVASVVGPQDPTARRVIEKAAEAAGALLFRFDWEWCVDALENGLHYESKTNVLDLPPPALTGPHQAVNAGMAIACLEKLAGFEVGAEAIAQGLSSVDWPARIQHLAEGRLMALLPAGAELWLDGGHNRAAGESLAAVAEGWRDKPLHLVFGMLKSKSPSDFLSPLAIHVSSLRAIAIPGEDNSLSAGESADAATSVGIDAEVAENMEAALGDIAARESGSFRALICGSLYLAGRVLVANG
jgi:dihydrofolate synthase/folylpolyglutamate synthase